MKKAAFRVDAAILLGAIGFLVACKQIMDLDLWWHLAAGRWIAENHSFIRQDPFSFTAQGLPWTSMTWLYESLCYGLHRIDGGFAFVTLFHASFAAAALIASWKTYLLLTRSEHKVSLVPAFLIFVIALPWIEFRWINRPEMASHALGAVFLFLLTREWLADSASAPRLRTVLLCVGILQAFWVNLHGLFVFGPALCGLFAFCAFLLEGRTRRFERLALMTGVALGSSLLNPYGIQGLLWPIHLLQVLSHPFYQTTIPEATNPLKDGIWRMDTWGLLAWGAIGATISVVLAKRDPRRFLSVPGPAWPVLFLILFYLSVQGRRNIAVFVLWTLPWVAAVAILFFQKELAEIRRKSPSWVEPLVPAVLTAALVLGLVTNLLRSPMSEARFGFGILPHHYAEGAASYLRNAMASGKSLRLFGTVEINDYLLFNAPGFQPYLDGRFAELYPLEHFQKYMEILAHPFLLEDEAKKRGLDGAVLGLSPPLTRGMINYLASAPNWKLAYLDETSVIFLRQEGAKPADPAPALSELHDEASRVLYAEADQAPSLYNHHWRADEARPWIQLSELTALLGDAERARKDLDRAIAIDRRNPEAAVTLCIQSYLATERLAQTEMSKKKEPTAPSDAMQRSIEETSQRCQNALILASSSPAVHQTLGLLLMNTGRAGEAVLHFQQVVKADPASFEGHWMLGRSLAMLGDIRRVEEMRRAYRRAASLRPFEQGPAQELQQLEAQIKGRASATSAVSRGP